MKRSFNKRHFLALICLLILGRLFAQDQNFFVHESENYRVQSEIDLSHAINSAENLELLIRYFSEELHFDPNSFSHKLRVRIFANRSSYANYIAGTTFVYDPLQNFIYFHNSDPERAELVGVVEDKNSIDPSFVHQSFIQYLRTFINNPPLWIREGLAIYFESTSIINGVLEPNENLSWLEEAKRIILDAGYKLNLNQLLLMELDTVQSQIHLFYPQSWALVYFLLNSDDSSFNRILWDALRSLEPQASLSTNSLNIYNQTFRWTHPSALISSMNAFFEETKTYAELIEEAVKSYDRGELGSAEESMRTAISRNDTSPIPHYYLGLLEYERMNYTAAEVHYLDAIRRGQEDPIVYYALGLNSYASNQYNSASTYLMTARRLDTNNSYTERIIDIENRIDRLLSN